MDENHKLFIKQDLGDGVIIAVYALVPRVEPIALVPRVFVCSRASILWILIL